MPLAAKLSRYGVMLMMSVPIAAIVLRSPVAIGVVIGISVIMQLLGALAYLIVLPEEWDASFNKALPILIEGEYISEAQHHGARQVLKAAALTYFAGALASILNIGRWLMILRR
jgi:Zn-dependent membrane protease YugP